MTVLSIHALSWQAYSIPNGYSGNSRVTILPWGLPLNTIIGVNALLDAVIQSATVALFVSFVDFLVEKSVFSIWVDLFLCRSIQLLVLSYAEMFVYMYLSQLMSNFTKLSKGASSSRWFLHSMTRRTSDPTITHTYLYTHVSQI